VAINAAWRRAWEGVGPADVGAGAAAEADELHGLFNDDREAFQRKIKLVLLPGSDAADVPAGLDRLPRFRVPSFDRAGVEDLLRTLTNQPQWPLVELGAVPILPPTARAAIEHLESGGASEPESAATRVTVTRSTTWNVAAPDLAGHLRDEIALLDSVLRQLPTPQPGEGPHLPWYREWERAQTQRARLHRQLAVLEDQISAAADSMATSSEAEQRLTALVDRLCGALEPVDHCWLVLAATLDPPGITQDEGVGDAESGSVRERRRLQVEQWARRVAPIVPIDTSLAVVRAPGRVVFPGSLPSPEAGTTRPDQSKRWRFELYDDGTGIGAADVADHPRWVLGNDPVGSAGQPAEFILDAEVYLPVRRDRLEAWLLTELELLTDHARSSGADERATLWLLLASSSPNA